MGGHEAKVTQNALFRTQEMALQMTKQEAWWFVALEILLQGLQHKINKSLKLCHAGLSIIAGSRQN